MISDSPSSGSPSIVDPSKLGPRELWTTEIAYAEQELKKFHERARTVVRRFVDERDALDAPMKWFNLFYANTKIMKAALYSQLPKPEVKRKFIDYNDQLARVAANMLQRAIQPDGDDPRDLFDPTMRHVSLDRLVSGLGQAWCRLETDTEDAELILEGLNQSVGEGLEGANDHHNSPLFSGFKTGPAPDEGQPAQGMVPGVPVAPGMDPAAAGGVGGPPGGPGMPDPAMAGAPGAGPQSPAAPAQAQTILKYKRITDQRVAIDYVYWEDFLWSPCRVWEERRWVGRRVYMDRPQLIKRFGEEKGKKVPLNHRPSNMNLNTYPGGVVPVNQAVQMACVYEIWDRIHRKVIWLSKDMPEVLDEKDDFLNLVGFEPCPRPLLANISTSNTVPRPDYYLVQDQYNELDQVNNRISMLVKACKVVGVYDQAATGIQRMLLEGTDNTLIPVDNWAMFAEKGGVKGQVDWLPLEQVVNALQRLYEAREGIKAQIYELTGIADIVRGASKASETLGAQEIKAKFASVRIKDTQDEVARFAAELLRIKAEIMVKHFDPELLIRKSNIMRTDDADLALEATELLQSEEGFEWRITVTADQLAQTDYAMEKADRIELLTSVSGYLQTAAEMIQGMPQSGPLLVGLLKWTVAGFKGAREIEGMLDKALDELIKAPPEEQPDPEAERAKAEMEMAQQEHQLRMQELQAKIAAKQQETQLKIQAKIKEMELADAQGRQEIQMEIQRMHMELMQSQQEHQFKMMQMREEHDMKRQQMQIDGAMKAQQTREQGLIKTRQAQESGQVKIQQMRAEAKARPKPKGVSK
jgi:hypothetical protein